MYHMAEKEKIFAKPNPATCAFVLQKHFREFIFINTVNVAAYSICNDY